MIHLGKLTQSPQSKPNQIMIGKARKSAKHFIFISVIKPSVFQWYMLFGICNKQAEYFHGENQLFPFLSSQIVTTLAWSAINYL